MATGLWDPVLSLSAPTGIDIDTHEAAVAANFDVMDVMEIMAPAAPAVRKAFWGLELSPPSSPPQLLFMLMYSLQKGS